MRRHRFGSSSEAVGQIEMRLEGEEIAKAADEAALEQVPRETATAWSRPPANAAARSAKARPSHRACPQQNGRHERMHLTLKQQTTRPPGMNILQQQAAFDDFMKEFNNERPHEALNMQCPAELYTPAARQYNGLPELDYPMHDRTAMVTACGRLCLHRKKINISTVFAGQKLGLREVDDALWLVSFMHYDLGYIHLEEKTLQTIDNPFTIKALPVSR